MTLIFHPRYLEHMQTHFHPESPERLKAIRVRLEKEGLWKDILEPSPAKKEDVVKVHTEAFYDFLRDFGEGYVDMGDTYMHKETFEIALLAVGGGLLAAREARKRKRPNFALLRPPGHHATQRAAMGFCYLNNVAIAAQAMRDEGVERVAILDTDLHHGNGTHDIFLDRKDVLYISTHQWGNYPGTGPAEMVGVGVGQGFTVNIPFTSGCGDGSFEYAFDRVIEPVLRQFKPGIILVSIGGDAHYKDPLGGLSLSTEGYVSMNERLLALAKELCGGSLSFFLEGGYNVDALADIVAGTVSAFGTGKRTVKLAFPEADDDKDTGTKIVDRVVKVHNKFWDL
jgi:acetoin utilization deacetylase AcuC-like enzyme